MTKYRKGLDLLRVQRDQFNTPELGASIDLLERLEAGQADSASMNAIVERLPLMARIALMIQRHPDALSELERTVIAFESQPEPAAEVKKAKPAKKRDLAEKRRVWFENWYRGLGFAITVPMPMVNGEEISNHEFARRAKLHQALEYRPATREVSYEAFMAACGQSGHWTVKDESERAKIAWEPAPQGYWFWADVSEACPRLGRSWEKLTASTHLLCLEEYVLVWHAFKAETERMLDVPTWCWLRTRFGFGALFAGGCGGRVRVHGFDAGSLSYPGGSEGGRSAEVVD